MIYKEGSEVRLTYHNWEWRTIHDYWKYGGCKAAEELPGKGVKGEKGDENNKREDGEYKGEETKNFNLFLLRCKYDKDENIYSFNNCSCAIHCWY